MRAFEEWAAATRAEVERALERVLPTPPLCPPRVAEAIRYSVLAGGKRLRPLLVLAAGEAVAGPSDETHRLVIPTACAVEMIHTYSLIHDDLPAMDDDHLRRGRPTLHVRCGEGMAILAGDGLQAEAFALIAREPAVDGTGLDSRKLRVIRALAEASGPGGMVGGQAIDLASTPSPAGPRSRPLVDGVPVPQLELDADGLRDMHMRKTGALIRASAMAGAVMAGASEAVVGAADEFGTAVGLAFQIVDDILDVEAGSDALGKTAGKDAAAGKLTYVTLYGVERSRELARECRERAEAALDRVGLQHSMLRACAAWITERGN